MTVDRSTVLGASEVAGVLGLSPWDTPFTVWLRKVELGGEKPDSEAMEFGRRAEDMLGRWFTDRTGLYVYGEQTWHTHPRLPWFGATVDGMAFASTGDEVGTVEYKTTSEPEWDIAPDHYQCQAQAQMACTGASCTWFGVLHIAYGRPKFRVYELARDEANIAYIERECSRWWTEHVETGVPPEVTGHDADTRALGAIPAGVGSTVATTADLALVQEFRLLKEQSKELERVVQDAGNRLRARLGEATELVSGGRVVLSWRAQKVRRLDVDGLRVRLPRVAERFTVESEQRVLRPAKPKGETE
jgi:putative phage-type endonuclease